MLEPLLALRRLVADAVLRVAPPDYLLRRSAERLGIASFGVDGALGHFQGPARDQAIQGTYLVERTWAPELQALLEAVLRGGGTLLDVGANLGFTSIPISRARDVRCYAFEPDPENYAYLVSNIAWNRADRVKPFNLAVMAQEGTLKLERSPENIGDHRVRLGDGKAGLYAEERRGTVDVQARRLDRVLEGEVLTAPIVLKVDTQGAEVQVLEAAAGLLPRVEVAVLEFWPYGLRRMGDTPDAFYERVSSFPFGGVLEPGAPLVLRPLAELVAELRRRLPQDGSTKDHLDVVVSRRPSIP